VNTFILKTLSTVRHYLSFWHLKRVLIFLVADVFLLSFVRRRASNTVFILKCDMLGDYIINRNLLRAIRQHSAYKGMKVVLCANLALKDFIQTYDGDAFDSFIWIDRGQFLDSFWPRFQMLRQIKELGSAIAINTIYYREPYLVDCVMRATCAPQRIGRASSHDPASLTGEKVLIAFALTDAFYTKLIPEDSGAIFDFPRNRAFLADLFPDIELPADMRLNPIPVAITEIQSPFAIIMPGASMAFREWPPERFAEIVLHLSQSRGMRMVFLGTQGDRAKADAIIKASPGVPVDNLCGRLSLPQIAYLASKSEVGLTNDSGGIHIFAALSKIAAAVSSTSSFGLFHPYPKNVSDKVAFVYPPDFYKLKLTFDERKKVYSRGRHYSMTDIPASSVVERLEILMRDGHDRESLDAF
jgi:ADP-heptose:LPS heptosyltransferase